MEMSNKQRTSPLITLLFISASFVQCFPYVSSIGINYGTLGNNLPPPSQVAQFLKEKTIINKIKIADMNPEILRAFANTNISVIVTASADEIPKLLDIGYAKKYVETHIKPFYPQTKIEVIAIGNNLLPAIPEVQNKLVDAMKTLYQALTQSGINTIKVSTAHTIAILQTPLPSSQASFKQGLDSGVLAPMLKFLKETKGPFMVNLFPYHGYKPQQADFLLFKPNSSFVDPFSKTPYKSMFDLLLDSFYMSMKRVGNSDVEIVVSETGWPSRGEANEPQCTVENAASYNGGVVKKLLSGEGTPSIPKKIDTYLFGLFNEDAKLGSAALRFFGLFKPDFTPIYNIGLMKGQSPSPAPAQPKPHAQPALSPHPQPHPQPQPALPQPHPQPQPGLPQPGAHPQPHPQPQPQPGLPQPGAHPQPQPHPVQGKPVQNPTQPGPNNHAQPDPKTPVKPSPNLPAQPTKKYCLPRPEAKDAELKANIDWICANQGVDCRPTQPGGQCFNPNTVRSHAAYVMNSYYQIKGRNDFNCDFKHTGAIAYFDPSYGACKYL